MASKHRDIDEYVRRAVPISDEAVAGLVDPHARQELLDRILDLPVPGETAAPARTGRSRRTRLALAGAAAAVLLAGGFGAVTALDGSGRPDADRPPPAAAPTATGAGGSVPLAGNPAARCAENYDAETGLEHLAGRAFAFDGTVIEIVEPAAAGQPERVEVAVTFRVEEWFRGGDTGQFTVLMWPPLVETRPTDPFGFHLPAFQVGSRLLVSGEDRSGSEQLDRPVAWYCGFTRTYSAGTAALWRQTFAAG